MTDDITELRAALAAATPGPWHATEKSSKTWHLGVYTKSGDEVAHVAVKSALTLQRRAADAHLMAACSPDRIARLLDRLEAAERDAARYRWLDQQQALNNPDEDPARFVRAIDAAMHTEGEP